jgi:hypothetical protein
VTFPQGCPVKRESGKARTDVVRGLLLVLGAERHAAFLDDRDGGGIVELDVGGDVSMPSTCRMSATMAWTVSVA